MRNNKLPTKEYNAYTVLHIKLARARGSAKTHICVDCGVTAAQWSLIGRQPHYRECQGVFWSENFDDYEPRCRRCHNRYDKAMRFELNQGRPADEMELAVRPRTISFRPRPDVLAALEAIRIHLGGASWPEAIQWLTQLPEARAIRDPTNDVSAP